MVREYCHFHTSEDVEGEHVGADVGYVFTCHRNDHPEPGPYTWHRPPPAPVVSEISGLAEELGLATELSAVLKQYGGTWVEYGVVEHAYATANPQDWQRLLNLYGHTAIKSTRYSASAFLASTLGHLSRMGDVCFHDGPATGRWAYNGRISWWSLPPAPDWDDAPHLSWADSGLTVEYVPGRAED